MRLPNLAEAAARAVHAVVTEYRRIDAPPAAPQARTEMSCTGASTQVNTAAPRAVYRRPSPEVQAGDDDPGVFGFARRN